MAGMLTRGLAEMTRIATRLGANPLTLSGLSGMGDLVLTYTDRTLGFKLGKGKTLEEAKAIIDIEVQRYFKTYYLQVKLGGIRFATLGEFNRSGKQVILQNQATIYEAIAAAGDLGPLAKRDEIRLIRQYPEGTKIHTINLLDQSIIGSPYYFIQPNDVLYAEPLPQKAYGFGVTGAQTITTLVSALSSSLALYLTIISLRQ